MLSLADFKQFSFENTKQIMGGTNGTVMGSSQYQGHTLVDVLWDGNIETTCDALEGQNDSFSEESILGKRVNELGGF